MLLKDVIKKFEKSLIKAGDGEEKGQYPLYTCSPTINKYLNDYIVNDEAIIISTGGNFSIHYVNGKFNYSTDCLVFKSTKFRTKYLYYYLLNNRKIIDNMFRGAGIKHLNKREFMSLNVDEVSFEEQDKIIEQLDCIECAIDNRSKQIEDLNKLINSQFVEMFGNLKHNDKKWEYVDVLGNITILNPSKSEIKDIDKSTIITFLPMQNVSTTGVIDYSIEKSINEVWRGFTYFKENDVLFAKITPCMENGKGAVARNLKNGIGFGTTEFHVIRPKKLINSQWLYTFLSDSEFRREAEKNMTGSAGQKRVPISFLANYKLAVPPIELQDKFEKIVKLINEEKTNCESDIMDLQKLLEVILHNYFSKEVTNE